MAEASGARRLWLITTNDNVDALRFYQRRGFRLARVHAGAVDRSRATLKPAIPEIGAHEIPLRDELELEMRIGDAPTTRRVTSPPRSSPSSSPWPVATRRPSPAATRPSSPPTSSRSARAASVWTRAEILEVLHAEPPTADISIEGFDIATLSPELVLATFDTTSPGAGGVVARRRRSSIWIRAQDRWQVRFHQGTPVRDEQA